MRGDSNEQDAPQQPGGEHEVADGRDRAWPEPAGQRSRPDGQARYHRRPGGNGQAGAQRGIVPDGLAPQHVGQQHGGESDAEDECRQARWPEPGAAPQEPAHGDRGPHEQADGPGGRPAPGRSLDMPAGQPADRRRQQSRPGEVGQWLGGPRGRVRQHPQAHSDAKHANGQVDQEDPAPVGCHEQPADDRPQGGGDAADRSPGAHPPAAAIGRRGRQQQGQRGGD